MIKRGELLLLLGKEKSYLVECKGKFTNSEGSLDLEKLIGKKFGTKIKIGNEKFTVVEPTTIDILFKKAKRGPQIAQPKDLSLVASVTGLKPGWKIVDAGTGSGFASIFFANLGSKVFTYEKKKEWFERARKNFSLFNLDIKSYNRDITKGIKEKNIDLVFLDMENPEKVVKHAYKALKPGRWLTVHSMHVEQVQKLVKEIDKRNFTKPLVLENIQREWKVEIGKRTWSRPKTNFVHSIFLTFTRKI